MICGELKDKSDSMPSHRWSKWTGRSSSPPLILLGDDGATRPVELEHLYARWKGDRIRYSKKKKLKREINTATQATRSRGTKRKTKRARGSSKENRNRRKARGKTKANRNTTT